MCKCQIVVYITTSRWRGKVAPSFLVLDRTMHMCPSPWPRSRPELNGQLAAWTIYRLKTSSPQRCECEVPKCEHTYMYIYTYMIYMQYSNNIYLWTGTTAVCIGRSDQLTNMTDGSQQHSSMRQQQHRAARLHVSKRKRNHLSTELFRFIFLQLVILLMMVSFLRKKKQPFPSLLLTIELMRRSNGSR